MLDYSNIFRLLNYRNRNKNKLIKQLISKIIIILCIILSLSLSQMCIIMWIYRGHAILHKNNSGIMLSFLWIHITEDVPWQTQHLLNKEKWWLIIWKISTDWFAASIVLWWLIIALPKFKWLNNKVLNFRGMFIVFDYFLLNQKNIYPYQKRG